MTGRTIGRALLVFLLLLAVGVGICEWLGWPFLRGPMERTLSRALERPVELGKDFELHLLGSIRLDTDLVAVGEASPAASGKGAAQEAQSPQARDPAQEEDGRAAKERPSAGRTAGEGEGVAARPSAASNEARTNRLPEGEFLRATDVRLEVPYSTVISALQGDLGSEPPTVTALEVGTLDVALERDADGSANWSFGDAEAAEGQQDASAGVAAPIPRFERLVVEDGHVTLDDEILDLQLEASIRTREGTAGQILASGETPGARGNARQAAGGEAGANPGEPRAGDDDARSRADDARTSGDAQSAARPATDDESMRGLAIDATGTYQGNEFEASVRTSGVLPLITSNADSPPVPMRIDAQAGATKLSLDGQAGDILALKNLEGSYRLEAKSLAEVGELGGLALPATAPFELQGTASKHDQVYATKIERFAVGSSRLSGEFRYDPTAEVPKLTGVLAGERLALADLAPAFGAESQKEKDDDGRLLPQEEFDIPALDNMEAEVEIDLDSADFGTEVLGTLEPLRGRLSLHDRVLAIEGLEARSAGGRLDGSLSMDARREQPRWSARLNWGGIKLERFIKARNPLNPKDGKGGEGAPYITGTFGGRADFKGVGRSTAAMLGSLDGSTDLWVTDGEISHLVVELVGIDVAQSLGVAVSGDENLEMRCAVARLVAENGLLIPEVAIIDTPDTTVRVHGEVSLAKEQLKLLLSARPKDFSPVALRAPVHVEGTFADPAFRPDAGTIGLRLAGAAVLAAITPVASLLALFDPGDPNTAACAKALEESGAPPGEGTGDSLDTASERAAEAEGARGKAGRDEGAARK